jgi:hypothetical protein
MFCRFNGGHRRASTPSARASRDCLALQVLAEYIAEVVEDDIEAIANGKRRRAKRIDIMLSDTWGRIWKNIRVLYTNGVCVLRIKQLIHRNCLAWNINRHLDDSRRAIRMPHRSHPFSSPHCSYTYVARLRCMCEEPLATFDPRIHMFRYTTACTS